MNKENLQTVLDALERAVSDDRAYISECKQAIALVQKELERSDEPVMFAYRYADGSWHDASSTEHSAGMQPLYAHPPLSKEPVYGPLSDTALLHLWSYEAGKSGYNTHELPVRFARVVIAQYGAAPQERKPLTNQQIDDIMHPLTVNTPWNWQVFARAIEAAHGITGATE